MKKKTPKKKDGIEFYCNKTRNSKASPVKTSFRWRIRRKGFIIAASTEAYSELSRAVSNLFSIGQMAGYTAIKAAVLEFKNRKK